MRKIQKTLSNTKSHCKNCGTKPGENNHIITCEICGKEICEQCTDTTFTYTLRTLGMSMEGDIQLTEYNAPTDLPHMLCRNCASKIAPTDFTIYKNKVKELIQSFNRKMELLAKDYLKGNIDI